MKEEARRRKRKKRKSKKKKKRRGKKKKKKTNFQLEFSRHLLLFASRRAQKKRDQTRPRGQERRRAQQTNAE